MSYEQSSGLYGAVSFRNTHGNASGVDSLRLSRVTRPQPLKWGCADWTRRAQASFLLHAIECILLFHAIKFVDIWRGTAAFLYDVYTIEDHRCQHSVPSLLEAEGKGDAG